MSNKPDDTPFKQQRLKAWQPILTPDQGYVNCTISQQNQGYNAIQANAAMNCYLTFNFTQDIPESTPVEVFYQLTNFFQNHRRYVKSRNDLQVGGGFVPDATLSTSCDPQASYVSNTTGLIYAPCGLIATSHFNDAFFVQSPSTVSMNEKNIAWPTDLSLKFKNPTNKASSPVTERPLNNWSKYQYLWQTYDQMSCYNSITGMLAGCQTWAQVTGDAQVYGKGCAQCNVGDVPRYEGGVPPPGFPAPFDASINALGNATSPFGFRDEHFVVWMRTAGLSKFRKLYGTLIPPPGGFKAGDQVTFEVVPNFEVESFSGTKALVLATMTPTGGKSDVLGIAYLVVGSLCVLIALLFLVKQIVAPRKLGDPSYIGKRAD
ncbi:hypothetical protein BASA81_002597 [Batrachochytrium salamandrivorans]|nr:hypothetical protein BASA81_002597 [Batrachochytrium salamandrivorans]